MQSILVTGACGYIGSQLLQSLASIETALTVRLLDNLSTGSYSALRNLPQHHSYEFIEGDILNPYLISKALEGVDVLVHLAAIVLTPMGLTNSRTIQQVNHWGTLTLFEEALKQKVGHVIHLSSTAVYGPKLSPKELGFRPFGAYAQAKYETEKSLESLKSRGLNVTILRLATVYGQAPVTRYDAFINKLISMAATRKQITVHGSGDQTRPALHVKDASGAILFCLDQIAVNQSLNVLEANYSVNEIADSIVADSESVKRQYIDQDIRSHYSFEVSTDLLSDLGWSPEQKLKDEIRKEMHLFTAFRRPL